MFLHSPTSGEVLFNGLEIFKLSREALRSARKEVQIVFQDPYWSLNPRWLVRDIVGEPLKVHKNLSSKEYLEACVNLAEMVRLPSDSVYKYPHEFSGGQRQKIAIARALAVNPKLIILDEPTSAIDVMSQFQVLELLDDLKKKLKLTYIVISHDLSVVNYMASRIIVMYLGKIVEHGNASEILGNPKHPYTKALFDSIPDINTRNINDLAVITGEVPSAINPPPGCRFNPRCEHCMKICTVNEPLMRSVDESFMKSVDELLMRPVNEPLMKSVARHEVACFLYDYMVGD